MILRAVLTVALSLGLAFGCADAALRLTADSSLGVTQVTEVVGDLRTAQRITVLVPGAEVDEGTFHTGLGGVTKRAPARWAKWLARESRDPNLVVVAWLGYLPPSGTSVSVARAERAEVGAKALTKYIRELVAANPRATITIVGHSYGSVVVGHAARDLPVAVTDLVLIASPGTGSGSARDLGTNARVWQVEPRTTG